MDFSEKPKESTLAQIGAKINKTDHKTQIVRDDEINLLIKNLINIWIYLQTMD